MCSTSKVILGPNSVACEETSCTLQGEKVSRDDLNVELSVKRFRFCPLLICARGQFKAKASEVIFFLGHWP